jgi:anti-anti-sigma factor
MLHITLLSDDGAVVRLQAEGQISQTQFQGAGNPLENALGPSAFGRKVLLNLERTDYIDSSGISWLIVNHKHFREGGGMLVLHSLPPRVNQVLLFCRMESVFHLAPNESAARALALGEKRA